MPVKLGIQAVLALPGRRLRKQLSSTYELPGGYKRIYHYHIRKSAGTSINRAFFSLTGQDGKLVHDTITSSGRHWGAFNEYVFVVHNKYLINSGEYFYGYSHSAQHELRVPKNTFTFTCLRDPVRRVISHYRMLMHYRANNLVPRLVRTEGPWLGSNFGDFLDNIPKTHLLRQLYMFSKTFDIDEALENLDALSFVLRNEHFDDGIAELSSRLELPLKTLRSKSGYDEVRITDPEHARLRELMQPEYRMLARFSGPET